MRLYLIEIADGVMISVAQQIEVAETANTNIMIWLLFIYIYRPYVRNVRLVSSVITLHEFLLKLISLIAQDQRWTLLLASMRRWSSTIKISTAEVEPSQYGLIRLKVLKNLSMSSFLMVLACRCRVVACF